MSGMGEYLRMWNSRLAKQNIWLISGSYGVFVQSIPPKSEYKVLENNQSSYNINFNRFLDLKLVYQFSNYVKSISRPDVCYRIICGLRLPAVG